MISVIAYGRNDTHGYNHHRRAALSLNCLAEILDSPGDEIVFVDYNTPDELPTFVEALADTLTDRCLELLRVIRMPAAIHEQRFGDRTHLAVVEPVARNVAARRSNPANRWLLSTNTDMIFVPRSDRSLGEICRDLPDGSYGLPRFELPEWLWEQFPRDDPGAALSKVKRLGPALRLDEPTLNDEWILFDAPGDFQLVLREAFFSIDGFDEEMLFGWHVDSNLSRRMFLHFGEIHSLEEHLAGYHCNHNRIPTVYHDAPVANDFARFTVLVDRPELPEQRASWGLARAVFDEPMLEKGLDAELVVGAIEAITEQPGPRMSFDARGGGMALIYDSGHVLPFIADSLAVSTPDTVVGYVGANPILERMLASLVPRLGIRTSLATAELDDEASIDELDRIAHVIIADLGIDASLVQTQQLASSDYEDPGFPRGVLLAFAAFERLVRLERARLELGEHPRRFVLVNGSTAFWNGYERAHLNCSPGSFHARVQNANVKLAPEDCEPAGALERALRYVRWDTRPLDGRLRMRTGEIISLSDLKEFRGFGDGWARPESGGVWTQGTQSELALAVKGLVSDCTLTLAIGKIGARDDEVLDVELRINGVPAASRHFRKSKSRLAWHVTLPRPLPTNGALDLTFVLQEPRSKRSRGWPDDRQLGLHIRRVTVRERHSIGFLRGALREARARIRLRPS